MTPPGYLIGVISGCIYLSSASGQRSAQKKRLNHARHLLRRVQYLPDAVSGMVRDVPSLHARPIPPAFFDELGSWRPPFSVTQPISTSPSPSADVQTRGSVRRAAASSKSRYRIEWAWRFAEPFCPLRFSPYCEFVGYPTFFHQVNKLVDSSPRCLDSGKSGPFHPLAGCSLMN